MNLHGYDRWRLSGPDETPLIGMDEGDDLSLIHI